MARPMPDGQVVAGIRTIRVPDGGRGRVDRFVADATGLSRSYVQKLISDGRLTSDGETIKANTIVDSGTDLRLDVPETERLDVVAAPGDPRRGRLRRRRPAHRRQAGRAWSSIPSPGHADDTLVNALLGRADGAEYGGIAGVARPGHRPSPGSRHERAADGRQARRARRHSLMAQLKARRVKKTYLALVQGSVSAAVGRIEAPIGRDPKHRTRMAVVPAGRPSTTGYRVRERFPAWTRAGARPRHRPDAPDPRPPRRHRPSHRRRSGVRDRDVAQGPGRARPDVPPRVATRTRGAVGRSSHPSDGRRCRPNSRPSWWACGPRAVH